MIAETWPEQIRFIRSIKGAAASILWVLILSGRACTNEDLQLATNYSDKPIKDGLSLLEAEGLVQYNGKFNGWSLAGGFYQLPLPFHQLVAGVALLDIRADENESAALPVAVGADLNRDDRNISDLLSSSSSYREEEKIDREEEEEKKADETRKNSEIRGLLVGAGVAPRSSTLPKLLEMGLDVDYVRAHVEYRRAALEQGEEYPVNWLINKLRCGDAAPVVRSSHKQRIPDDLRDIIKR